MQYASFAARPKDTHERHTCCRPKLHNDADANFDVSWRPRDESNVPPLSADPAITFLWLPCCLLMTSCIVCGPFKLVLGYRMREGLVCAQTFGADILHLLHILLQCIAYIYSIWRSACANPRQLHLPIVKIIIWNYRSSELTLTLCVCSRVARPKLHAGETGFSTPASTFEPDPYCADGPLPSLSLARELGPLKRGANPILALGVDRYLE
jgi:hypothetical protein